MGLRCVCVCVFLFVFNGISCGLGSGLESMFTHLLKGQCGETVVV